MGNVGRTVFDDAVWPRAETGQVVAGLACADRQTSELHRRDEEDCAANGPAYFGCTAHGDSGEAAVRRRGAKTCAHALPVAVAPVPDTRAAVHDGRVRVLHRATSAGGYCRRAEADGKLAAYSCRSAPRAHCHCASNQVAQRACSTAREWRDDDVHAMRVATSIFNDFIFILILNISMKFRLRRPRPADRPPARRPTGPNLARPPPNNRRASRCPK